MYEEGTDQRLRVLNEEGQVVVDRILLGTVRIEPSCYPFPRFLKLSLSGVPRKP
jgi:hypothetical protein